MFVSTSAATIVQIFAFPSAISHLRLFSLPTLPLFLTFDRRVEHLQTLLDSEAIVLLQGSNTNRVSRWRHRHFIAWLDSALLRQTLWNRHL